MTDCLISFGSNIGDSRQIISEALSLLQSKLQELQPQPVQFSTSEFFVTQPVGGPENQSEFINGVSRFRSDLDPIEILRLLHRVEQEFGRHRRIRWDSRTLDLDLLLYGDLELESGEIQIPHPRMSFRQFVLVPAMDIAADMLHPTCGTTLSHLLECVRTRKKNILLVTERANFDSILKKKSDRENNSDISVTQFAGAIHQLLPSSQYKLVVLDSSENHLSQHQDTRKQIIESHQGPLLSLRNQNVEQLEFEMTAAIETMKAI